MITCGIDIKGSSCIFLALSGSKENFEVLDCPKKIDLEDSSDATQVRKFLSQISTIFQELSCDSIIIKKRLEKGKFAGGPTSFKIEGLIQIATSSHVALIAGPALKRTIKDAPPLPQISKYQESAFYAAYSALT